MPLYIVVLVWAIASDPWLPGYSIAHGCRYDNFMPMFDEYTTLRDRHKF